MVKSDGLFTFYFLEDRLRFQIFWPQFRISFTEFWFKASTILRIVYEPKGFYYGAGFEIVGFGLGIDFKKF